MLLTLFVRVSAIAAVLNAGGTGGIIAACIVSRAMMPVLMAALPNARKSGLSHTVGTPTQMTVALGIVVAIALALLLTGAQALAPTIFAVLVAGVVALIAKAKIGGQTGDILGATQQLSEIAFLLALISQN